MACSWPGTPRRCAWPPGYGWRASTSPSGPGLPRAGAPPRRSRPATPPRAGWPATGAGSRSPSCSPITSGCVTRPTSCSPTGCNGIIPTWPAISSSRCSPSPTRRQRSAWPGSSSAPPAATRSGCGPSRGTAGKRSGRSAERVTPSELPAGVVRGADGDHRVPRRRARAHHRRLGCMPLLHDQGLRVRLPGRTVRAHHRRRRPLQLRAVLRMRDVLPGVQPRGRHHLGLSRWRRRRGVPEGVTAMTVVVAAMGWSWRQAEVDPLTGAVSADHRGRGPGPSELAALEHALRLAQRWDAQVIAATVGPAGADAMLRDALAVGAAEAVRVEPPGGAVGPRPADLVGGDQEPAAALAPVLRNRYGVPDLVLCGDRSADRGTGSFPAFLAAALGAAQALGVVRLEPQDGGVLQVHRRLDGGRREVLLVRPPAVVSVEAAGVRLRRAGLPATLASAQAAIPVAGAQALAGRRVRVLGAHPYRPWPRELPHPSGPALQRVLELTGALTERTPPTVLGPLPAAQAADELLGYLRRHGYLAAGDPG